MSCRSLAPLVIALATFSLGLADGVRAEQGAGMILAVSGEVQPRVPAYSELQEGALLRLASNARITIVHYATCQMNTVTGGTLVLRREQIITDGATVETRSNRCPAERRVRRSAAPVAEGIFVVRGIVPVRQEEPLHLGVKPSFVVAGHEAKQLVRAEIFERTGATAGAMKLRARLASWPAEAPALKPGREYAIRLTFSDWENQPEILFDTIDQKAESSPLLIVRTD